MRSEVFWIVILTNCGHHFLIYIWYLSFSFFFFLFFLVEGQGRMFAMIYCLKPIVKRALLI